MTAKELLRSSHKLLFIFSCMVVPKSLILFMVNSSAMAKVEIVGMNTIMIPLTTPGMDKGNITFQKTWKEFAPKSCALQCNFCPSSARVL